METSTKCRKCGVNMLIRAGKYGRFLACPNSNPSDNHGTYTFHPKVPRRKTSWQLRCSLDVDDAGESFDMLGPY